jgi:hypothetical protein
MRKKIKRYRIAVWGISLILCGGIFNLFAYEINELNTVIRVYIKEGKTAHRQFDKNGIPISYSARLDSFTSPFYVVHYGILYSESIRKQNEFSGFHWRDDPSLQYWNVPPNDNEIAEFEKRFKHASLWVLNHIDHQHGRAHLIYDFDWPYSNYPSGRLLAPWWSGLTDGYAIILLLRAYDYFQDERFLLAAEQLYNSVLTPVQEGGSLTYLDDHIWIEEYVDPRVSDGKMAYVLNGMIYATYGVEAYERFRSIKDGFSDRLYKSIASNIPLFDKSGWSYYDLIGNASSIKYHKIHVALLSDILARRKGYKDCVENSCAEILSRWSRASANSGIYYAWVGQKTFSYYHFLLSYFACVLVVGIILNTIFSVAIKYYSKEYSVSSV